MAFHDVRFPETVAVGSRGGAGYRTNIVELADSGAEERVARWSQPRARFDVSSGIKSKAQYAEVLTFYHARKGALHSFRFKNWRDFTSFSDHVSAPTFADQEIGVGTGSATQFQLTKKYTSGGIDQTVNITLPVAGTVKVALDGVEQTSGWTVDSTTGIVTFTSAPTAGQIITAGYEYDLACRFGKEADELLDTEWGEADNSRLPSIPVLEVPSETPVQDEFFYGGAKDWGNVSSNQAVNETSGRVQRFVPTAGSLFILLPDPATYALGGPYFYFINGSGSNTIGVKNELGISLGTIPTNSVRTVILAAGSGGNTWLLY